MGDIYLLSSEQELAKFMLNPRPYLLPPQPKAPIRLAVVGPEASGEQDLANLLGRHLEVTVVDLKGRLKNQEEELLNERLEAVKKSTTEKQIEIIQKRNAAEISEMKSGLAYIDRNF
ncbi:unnamed protein product [Protopolystoma xenopodis]|uniref:Uncharacterized protein n=1 Tax=Protopolystoma xenopodis TaxID=117903 RepID=A0A448WKR6_9PLAT|nr:unnamed protein product [Protopolystoma xenopodis]